MGGEHYALEVKGDSMIEAGIFDGDTVIIRNADTAQPGEIIVALVDEEEATLKRFRRKGASIALEAANPAYETRIFGPDRVKVQGKLVGWQAPRLTRVFSLRMPGSVRTVHGEADDCWRDRRLVVEENGRTAFAGKLPFGDDENQGVVTGIISRCVIDNDQIGEAAGFPGVLAIFDISNDRTRPVPGQTDAVGAIERRSWRQFGG
eukprot:gene64761-88592_t